MCCPGFLSGRLNVVCVWEAGNVSKGVGADRPRYMSEQACVHLAPISLFLGVTVFCVLAGRGDYHGCCGCLVKLHCLRCLASRIFLLAAPASTSSPFILPVCQNGFPLSHPHRAPGIQTVPMDPVMANTPGNPQLGL